MNDDSDLESEFGFEPAVSPTGASGPSSSAKPERAPRTTRRRSRGLRSRLGAGVVMVGALAAMGGAYAALATSSGAAPDTPAASSAAGQRLFSTSCITCHGANLEGVSGNGPSLIGVGQAAVYFQVSTGRMPLTAQGPYAIPHPNRFSERQTEDLADYVESVGGGPEIPAGNLRAGSKEIGQGGEMFRLNCASCHGVTFKGAPLSAGKIAPALTSATDKQIYAAMLSGPESMPVFSDNTITPAQKKAIIAYIQTIKASKDPGGSGIDRIGPVSEGIVAWAAGVGAIMIFILWIGARAR